MVVSAQAPLRYQAVSSKVSFLSEAPLERITASNNRATALLDPVTRQFAVRVPVVGFEGFNSPLQQEHFRENYLDADDWPTATFQGRIIEPIDLATPAVHQVRAKGMFTIRGLGQERIIACTVEVDEQGISVRSTFPVVLADHGINIPKVVMQKLAPEVRVEVEMHFKPGPDQRE